jgi:hypothetical protein
MPSYCWPSVYHTAPKAHHPLHRLAAEVGHHFQRVFHVLSKVAHHPIISSNLVCHVFPAALAAGSLLSGVPGGEWHEPPNAPPAISQPAPPGWSSRSFEPLGTPGGFLPSDFTGGGVPGLFPVESGPPGIDGPFIPLVDNSPPGGDPPGGDPPGGGPPWGDPPNGGPPGGGPPITLVTNGLPLDPGTSVDEPPAGVIILSAIVSLMLLRRTRRTHA